MMKFLIFVLAALLSQITFASEIVEVRFFSGVECNNSTIITSLPFSLGANNCHQYAIDHSLQNSIVKSFGYITDDGIFQGSACVTLEEPAFLTFEDACSSVVIH